MRKRFAPGGDDTPQAEPEATDDRGIPLRCTAPGCPMRWSIDFTRGRLCHWHDNAKQADWPGVTMELRDMAFRGVQPIYATYRGHRIGT